MPTKNLLSLTILTLLCVASGASAQTDKLPILNGAAVEMPKPENLSEAEDRCVKGEMRVEIEYKAAGGSPASATMISGDEFVRESVEAAAM